MLYCTDFLGGVQKVGREISTALTEHLLGHRYIFFYKIIIINSQMQRTVLTGESPYIYLIYDVPQSP